MKLVNLKIEKLFGIFDYDINFDNPENLTILTAPNGFGKSTILRMLAGDAEESKKCEKIEVRFDNGEVGNWIKEDNNPPVIRTKNILMTNEKLFELEKNKINNYKISVSEIEQKIQIFIHKYKLFFNKIHNNLSFSFPKRILLFNNVIAESKYLERYKRLAEKQNKLHQYGFVENYIQEVPNYEEEHAKVLSMHLIDMEERVAVYDDLISKFDLFCDILNNRIFFAKKIKIDIFEGFLFTTKNNISLNANQLSTGEQHEFIMWFTLIFETQKDMLVLIDEPETSLHVSWQKRFLDDILEIIKLNDIQVIVATHSPQIINKHWDLVQELNAPTDYLETLKNE